MKKKKKKKEHVFTIMKQKTYKLWNVKNTKLLLTT